MRISDWSSDVCSSDLKAALTYRLKQEYRHNSLDPATDTVTISDRRARAIALTADHYDRLYGSDPALRPMRANYAMKGDTLHDPATRAAPPAFFLCPAWAASPERHGAAAHSPHNQQPEPPTDHPPRQRRTART